MLTGRHAIIAPRQLFSLFFLDWNQLDKLSARVLPAGRERVLVLMLRRIAELGMELGWDQRTPVRTFPDRSKYSSALGRTSN